MTTERKIQVETRNIVTPRPPREVVITLDEGTAELLHGVLRRIGGDITGPRGALDKLRALLERLHVGYDDAKTTGSVSFPFPGDRDYNH